MSQRAKKDLDMSVLPAAALIPEVLEFSVYEAVSLIFS